MRSGWEQIIAFAYVSAQHLSDIRTTTTRMLSMADAEPASVKWSSINVAVWDDSYYFFVAEDAA
jgi:hypothetical protein